MAGAQFVDDDFGRRVQLRDVAGTAGVVQVDVGDHHSRQVGGTDPEGRQGVPHNRRGWRGAGFDQARPVAADQVTRP